MNPDEGRREREERVVQRDGGVFGFAGRKVNYGLSLGLEHLGYQSVV